MTRKFILLTIVLLLLLGSVNSSLAETADLDQGTAESQQLPVSSGSETAAPVKKLTLEEAFELTLQNNLELKKAYIDYDKAIIDVEQARYNADEIDGDSISNMQDAQTKASLKHKQLARETAEQAYELAKLQTKNTVEKNYYDVLKAGKLVTIREASVERAQKQLNLVQKKFKAGSAIKTDVFKAESSLFSAKADLANAQRDYKNAQVTLNKNLGLDINTDVRPIEVLKYEKVTLPNVEELTKAALEKRLDLQRARNSATIAEENYNLLVSYQAPNTFSARKSKTDLEKAKLDVLQLEQNIRAEVISTLFQIQKADEVVQLMAKSLEQAKENQQLAQRRYEIGVGSSMDALTASIELADAEAKNIESVYNYKLAKNQLETVTK